VGTQQKSQSLFANFLAEMVTLFGDLENDGLGVELAIAVLEGGDLWLGSNVALVDHASLFKFCSRYTWHPSAEA
jgi:hypothetical protein